MKKLTLSLMTATMLLLLFSSTQLKAGNENNTISTFAKTTQSSEDLNVSGSRLNEIKAIDLKALSTSENKELLKAANSMKNDQGRHRGQRGRRDVDVTIRSDAGHRDYYGNHRHSGAYIGGGGVLLLILILILVL